MKKKLEKVLLVSALLIVTVVIFCFNVSAATIKSNMINNCEPYSMTHGYFGDVEMGGNTYEDSLYFQMGYTGKSTGHTADAKFNFNGKYKTLTFYAGWKSGVASTAWFTITVDGTEVEKVLLSSSDLPKQFTLSLKDVYQVVLRFDGNNGYDAMYYAIGGINMVSDGETQNIIMLTESLQLSNSNPSAYARAAVIPPDADNTEIKWSSSNSNIAKVDKNGLVTALSGGYAVITAKTVEGGYSATCNVSVDLPVMPKKVEGITTASRTKDSITLRWNSIEGVSGYQIYVYNSKSKVYDLIKTSGTSQCEIDALKTGEQYSFKVRAFIKENNRTILGTYSDVYKEATVLPTVKKLSAVQSTSAIKLTWKKVSGATGYRIYKYNSNTKKWEKIKTTTSTSYKVKDLKAGTTYKFRVKAYKKVSGTTLWSDATSTFTTATKPSTVKINSLTAGNDKFVAKWKKVSGATGYVIEYSTKKDFSSKKSITVKKGSSVKKTVKSLKTGKTYYVRVKAFKKVGNVKIYGAYSSVKGVRVK